MRSTLYGTEEHLYGIILSPDSGPFVFKPFAQQLRSVQIWESYVDDEDPDSYDYLEVN